jgi:hypothetical protein
MAMVMMVMVVVVVHPTATSYGTEGSAWSARRGISGSATQSSSRARAPSLGGGLRLGEIASQIHEIPDRAGILWFRIGEEHVEPGFGIRARKELNVVDGEPEPSRRRPRVRAELLLQHEIARHIRHAQPPTPASDPASDDRLVHWPAVDAVLPVRRGERFASAIP